jgi:hypothetical protein
MNRGYGCVGCSAFTLNVESQKGQNEGGCQILQSFCTATSDSGGRLEDVVIEC